MALQSTTKILPNWALAGLLGGFVAGTYFYSIRSVGDDSAEVRSNIEYLSVKTVNGGGHRNNLGATTHSRRSMRAGSLSHHGTANLSSPFVVCERLFTC